MSKDGVAFCLDSADLMADTTAMTSFMSRSNTVPEIQAESGIFSFDLTWSEIQTLKRKLLQNFFTHASFVSFESPLTPKTFVFAAQMANVLPDFHRNPAYKNAGKLTSLAEFLDLAKTNAVSGVLINIQVSSTML